MQYKFLLAAVFLLSTFSVSDASVSHLPSAKSNHYNYCAEFTCRPILAKVAERGRKTGATVYKAIIKQNL